MLLNCITCSRVITHTGKTSGMYGLSSVVGPLIGKYSLFLHSTYANLLDTTGGAFVDNITWRWVRERAVILLIAKLTNDSIVTGLLAKHYTRWYFLFNPFHLLS